jgi:hypothetical protein
MRIIYLAIILAVMFTAGCSSAPPDTAANTPPPPVKKETPTTPPAPTPAADTADATKLIGDWTIEGSEGTISFQDGGKLEFQTVAGKVKTDIKGEFKLDGKDLMVKYETADWTSDDPAVQAVLTPAFKDEQRKKPEVAAIISMENTGPIEWKSDDEFSRTVHDAGGTSVKVYHRVGTDKAPALHKPVTAGAG